MINLGHLYQQMIDEFGLTQEEIAQRKARDYVAHRLVGDAKLGADCRVGRGDDSGQIGACGSERQQRQNGVTKACRRIGAFDG